MQLPHNAKSPPAAARVAMVDLTRPRRHTASGHRCNTVHCATVTIVVTLLVLNALVLTINANHVTTPAEPASVTASLPPLRVSPTTSSSALVLAALSPSAAANRAEQSAPQELPPTTTTLTPSSTSPDGGSGDVAVLTLHHHYHTSESYYDSVSRILSNSADSYRDQAQRWRQVLDRAGVSDRRTVVRRDTAAAGRRSGTVHLPLNRARRATDPQITDTEPVDAYALNLTCHRIHSFHNSQDTAITAVDLSCNGLADAAMLSFDHLPQVQHISLRGNNLTAFAARSIFGGNAAPALRSLDLSANRLSALTADTFRGLQSLERLQLAHNDIATVDRDALVALGALQLLDLSYNRLDRRAVPALQALTGLVALRVAFNPALGVALQEFVDSWSLKELDASGTGLCEVPAALAQSVHVLNVSHNHFEIIRRGDLDSYPLLRYLDLSHCNITDIEDDALGRLEILITVQLRNNRITTVPTNLPSSLVHLLLDGNRITDIQPGTFAQLDQLQTLGLSGNRLTYVPGLPLPRLQRLDLRSSGLRGLSQSVVQLSGNLKDLLLEDNPIRCTELQSIAEWTTVCGRTGEPSSDSTNIETDGGSKRMAAYFVGMLSDSTAVELPVCCGHPLRRVPPKAATQCKREGRNKSAAAAAIESTVVMPPIKSIKKTRKAKMEDIWRSLSAESTTMTAPTATNAATAAARQSAPTASQQQQQQVNIITNNITISAPETPAAESINSSSRSGANKTSSTDAAKIASPATPRRRNADKTLAMATAQAADVRQAKARHTTATSDKSSAKPNPLLTTRAAAHLQYAKKKILARSGVVADNKKPQRPKSAALQPTSLSEIGQSSTAIRSDSLNNAAPIAEAAVLHHNSEAAPSRATQADESRSQGNASLSPSTQSRRPPSQSTSTTTTTFPVTQPPTTAPTGTTEQSSHVRIIDYGTGGTKRAGFVAAVDDEFVRNHGTANLVVGMNQVHEDESPNNEPNHLDKMLSDAAAAEAATPIDEHLGSAPTTFAAADTKSSAAEPTKKPVRRAQIPNAPDKANSPTEKSVDGSQVNNNSVTSEIPTTPTTTTTTSRKTENDDTNIYVAEQSLVAGIAPAHSGKATNAPPVVVIVSGADARSEGKLQHQSLIDSAKPEGHQPEQQHFETPPAPLAITVHSNHLPLTKEHTSVQPERVYDTSPSPTSFVHGGLYGAVVVMLAAGIMLLVVQVYRSARRTERQASRDDDDQSSYGRAMSNAGRISRGLANEDDVEAYPATLRDMLPMQLLGNKRGGGRSIRDSEPPIEMW